MAQILDTGGNLHTLTQFTEDNLKAVRYDTSAQGLDNTQKENARTNIDALGSTQSAVGLSATLTSEGLTYYTQRVSYSSGGYANLGDIVLVQIRLKATSTIETGEYRTIAYNFPRPFGSQGVAISVSPDDDRLSQLILGYISGNGTLYILPSSNLPTNKYFVVTGFYKKA